MKTIQSVKVTYHNRPVGSLSMGNGSCCLFEYDRDWLGNGFSISPLHLPLKPGLFTAEYRPFDGNFDDHARNFSFICRNGHWELAPAYDLTNNQTLGEHASSINFKGLPSDEDMVTVGMNTKMTRTRCQQIIEEVREATKNLP